MNIKYLLENRREIILRTYFSNKKLVLNFLRNIFVLFICLIANMKKRKLVFFEILTPLHLNFMNDLISRIAADKKFKAIIVSKPGEVKICNKEVSRTSELGFREIIKDYKLFTSSGYTGSNSIYVMHSLVSTHVIYSEGGFDGFGYIFCAGRHHTHELAEMLKKRKVKNCSLIPVGYELIDRLIEKENNKSCKNKNEIPRILFAPSWGDDNALYLHGVEIVKSLVDKYKICLRPHIRSIEDDSSVIEEICSLYGKHPNFELDLKPDSEARLLNADLMISDWSGVAFEYALSRLKPVVFIDVPMKVMNPNWKKYLDAPGIECTYREKLGGIIKNLNELPDIVEEYIYMKSEEKDRIEKRILQARSELVYNIGCSVQAGYEAVCKIADGKIGEDWENL